MPEEGREVTDSPLPHCAVDMHSDATEAGPSAGSSSGCVYSTRLSTRQSATQPKAGSEGEGKGGSLGEKYPAATVADNNGSPPRTLCRALVRVVRERLAVATLCVLLLSVALGSLTAHSYFYGQPDAPNCAMSYSRPRYIEQTEFGRSWTRYSAKYKLFLYREGGFDAHDTPYRIPVLFVPGNAGSHKQVRSIASSTSAAFVHLIDKDPEAVKQGQIGYDFFTISLNEELTALHGYSIVEQADFVNDAIHYILSLYPKTRAEHALVPDSSVKFAMPESVMVVGHSMGGVVARTAVTLPNYVEGSIQALFTLSTPHNSPTASLEGHVDEVYDHVNQFWRHGFANGTLSSVSLVSIAGGNLDSMINSDYTFVGSLAPHQNSLSVLSSGISNVWLSLDHQSILWCAQMARRFAHMLIRIMDARQDAQLVPLAQRMEIMRRELYSSLDVGYEDGRTPTGRKMTSEQYRFVHLLDDGALDPTEMKRLLAASQARPKKARALQLLSLEGRSAEKMLQLLYDPHLFAATSIRRKVLTPASVQPAILGCNRRADTNGTLDADVDVECETVLVPDVAQLPLKTDGDDPDLPVHSLHYVEHALAADSNLDQFEYVGIELPASTGDEGFVHAAIVDTPVLVEKKPGHLGMLLRSTVANVPISVKTGTRSRIRLDIPETPFLVFSAELSLQPSLTSAHSPRFRSVVRQSDGQRQFESKFWHDQHSMDMAIHGRGAYLQAGGMSEFSTAETDWSGLYIDVWADPKYYSGLSVSLRVNWYSSLNRLVKRYDMALLALSFVWACLILLDQLRVWNRAPNDNGGVYLTCLQSTERLIRNGVLAGMMVVVSLAPIVQELVASYLKCDGTDCSPAALAPWRNLFVGVRGAGWTLALVPMLVTVIALGFVILQAVFLESLCALLSYLCVLAGRWRGQDAQQSPAPVSTKPDILSARP
ncbi:GPI inositol deacylase [Coemansia sp. RSA 552]|nr:GPI inositol deacylase [Coemansia sp. RSA 552]